MCGHPTLLQSSVLVLSLSSEMKIMLLRFFFFLLFLSLTSASPTVTTMSSITHALTLPLERGRVDVQETGDSGGMSLCSRQERELNIDYEAEAGNKSGQIVSFSAAEGHSN